MIERFMSSAQGAATAFTAVAVTVITVGTSVYVGDHKLLVDQRDTLKSAVGAGSIAATMRLGELIEEDPGITDEEIKSALEPIATRYIEMNLRHMSKKRYEEAVSTLGVEVIPRRRDRSIHINAHADMGGTILANLFNLSDEEDRERHLTYVRSEAQSVINPIEVVLAIDTSVSMNELIDGRMACNCRSCVTDEQFANYRWCEILYEGHVESRRIAIVRRAAKKLVGILNPDEDKRIAVGVVPWHTKVRLDDEMRAQWAREDWAKYPTHRSYDQPSRGASPVEDPLPAIPPAEWAGCMDLHRIGPSNTRAALPDISDHLRSPSSLPFAQAFFPSEMLTRYYCGRGSYCYSGDNPTFPPQRGCEDTVGTMLPLSTDAEEINQTIDSLSPVGLRTYSGLGILWAQGMLEHGWKRVWGTDIHPVDRNDRANRDLRKAIVLLTDGEDTYCGRRDPNCERTDIGIPRIEACEAAKAQGTEIFVIAAMHPRNIGTDFGEALRECSSETEDSEMQYVFLDNSTPEELEATFETIAEQLLVIRRKN